MRRRGNHKRKLCRTVFTSLLLSIGWTIVVNGTHVDETALFQGRSRSRGSSRTTECRLVQVDTASMDQRHGYVETKCIPVVNGDELQVMLPLPRDLTATYTIRGTTDHVLVSDSYLEYGSDEEPNRLVTSGISTLSEIRGRRLVQQQQQVRGEPIVGRRTALMIRVTSRDSSPTLSADVLRRRLFYNAVTPASVLRDCSFGQFRLVPGTGSNIDRGVGDIQIDLFTNGQTMSLKIEKALTKAAQTLFGDISRFDFVMFCIPPGTSGDWSAYTGLGYYISYYNDAFAGILSAVVHELGHSVGLGHSGVDENPYADQSGYMGYGYRTPGAPAQCFNGYKNYVLGWYMSREVVVNPRNGPWGGRLIAFANYDKADDAVLVIVEDLYIQLNLAVRANRQTQGEPNRVTITQSRDVSHFDSKRVASLNLNDQPIYRAASYQNSGDTVIQVCEQDLREGYVYLSIHLSTDESVCRRPPEWKQTSKQCMDSTTGTFHVAELDREMDCVWLGLQKRYMAELCLPEDSSGARNICPATCGLCKSDECDDERANRSEGEERKCILEKLEEEGKATEATGSTGPKTSEESSKTEETSTTEGSCEDSLQFFHIDNRPRNCLWLSRFDNNQAILRFCETNPIAASHCLKTCDLCTAVLESHSPILEPRQRKEHSESHSEPNVAERLGGSASSSQLTDGPTVCDDDPKGTFFVEETGKRQTCVWLEARPQYTRILCEAGHPSEARTVCRETCGACNDRCEDIDMKFTIGHAVRNCVWLSLRPTMQEELCRTGFDAYEICGETCNVCD